METNDKAKFAQLMTGVAEVYGREMSEAGLSIWWQALESYDFEVVAKAMSAHSKDPERGQFMPKPGDIVRLTDGTATDAANEAWAKVDHAVRRYGTGPTWVFDDPRIHAVLHQMGGISQLGKMDERDFAFFREQFCKRYASRIDVTNYPRSLAGWYQDGQKAMIGNPEQCQKVLQGGTETPVISSVSQSAEKLLEDLRA